MNPSVTGSGLAEAARAEAFSMPLDQIDVSKPRLFQEDTIGYYFERLRRDDPVHHHTNDFYGSFWSVTKYKDIMTVDTSHGVYSSDWSNGGISIFEAPMENRLQMFISMDQPKHDEQRKSVSPIVAPANLASMEATIRSRTAKVLDELPRNETFDWVERVSIELTTMMLATLFDFPFEDRKLLTWWSNVATSSPEVDHIVESQEARLAELGKCLAYFTRLWNERVNAPPKNDLVSMLAHAPATRNMTPREYMGNLVLLIVGGNDTTRNSMTGGLYALHQNPGEFAKLRANPALVESMVPEIIRWQTPLPHMRRTALADAELGGKTIRKGDKVVMWYLSGNRDEEAIENADRFIIDRARPRQHLSFGFGIHRCVGNRLAEMQIRILWEEILKRFPVIEVVGDPTRVLSNFVRGFTHLPVRIPA
ncbi:MAG: cytochrome P450 [Betaproteobacteria bacterium]|nr:cytochrome P450 [Betaproteobacteria bacterium]